MKRPLFLFSFILLLLPFGCKRKSVPYSFPPSVALHTGDMAFRTGRSIESKAVTSADQQSTYSHVGLIVWNHNQWQVLHCAPNESPKGEIDKVKIEPLAMFYASDRASQGAIFRLPVADSDSSIILQRSLAISAQNAPFDNAFSDTDTTAYYCTELVWYIYKTALHIDITEGKRHKLPLFPPLIYCSDILAYPNLKKIYSF